MLIVGQLYGMQIIPLKLFSLKNSCQRKNKSRGNEIVIYKMCFVKASISVNQMCYSFTSQSMIRDL